MDETFIARLGDCFGGLALLLPGCSWKSRDVVSEVQCCVGETGAESTNRDVTGQLMAMGWGRTLGVRKGTSGEGTARRRSIHFVFSQSPLLILYLLFTAFLCYHCLLSKLLNRLSTRIPTYEYCVLCIVRIQASG